MSERVGTAAEEAVKLLGAVQGWLQERVADEHVATGSPECQVCPVCQVVGALRHVHPDAVEHLLDATASFVAAVKTVLTPPAPADAPRAAGVEHIPVREG